MYDFIANHYIALSFLLGPIITLVWGLFLNTKLASYIPGHVFYRAASASLARDIPDASNSDSFWVTVHVLSSIATLAVMHVFIPVLVMTLGVHYVTPFIVGGPAYFTLFSLYSPVVAMLMLPIVLETAMFRRRELFLKLYSKEDLKMVEEYLTNHKGFSEEKVKRINDNVFSYLSPDKFDECVTEARLHNEGVTLSDEIDDVEFGGLNEKANAHEKVEARNRR